MFKEKFNTLVVAIEDFILQGKLTPNFETTADQVKFYRTVVDEYNTLRHNLVLVLNSIDQTNVSLLQEIEKKLGELDANFEKYKDEFIVKSYIKELESFDEKNNFFERIYKFERMLVEQPLKKIDSEILQDILVYVREFAAATEKYYFFTNNPFNIDEDLGIVIPQRLEYDTADKFINGVYNYMYGLYNLYKSENEDALIQLDALEQTLSEKLYGFADDLRNAQKNKYHAIYGTTPEEYFEKVNSIKKPLADKLYEIVESGVYRFYALTKIFKTNETQYTELIEDYVNNDLYVTYVDNKSFVDDLDKLQEFVYLLEDGKVNEDKDYILTDINFKSLVENLISKSKDKKRKIYYTQKYHKTGISTVMTYEFYQTNQFLKDIKIYYYELMTMNLATHSKLTIDEYGDDTINEYRVIYKSTLSKYNQFIAQERDFMNDFEIQKYLNTLESLQKKLKISAMNFFDAAIKTSPATFEEAIENNYRTLLDKLEFDLNYQREKNSIDIIKLNSNADRENALTKLRDIQQHMDKLEHILYLSRKYIFIDMTNFIEETIYTPYKSFYEDIKVSFNKEEYIKLISDYDTFYKESIFDFNMLFSLERLSISTESIFSKIEKMNNTYIDEQISEKQSFKNQTELNFVIDLFDDETYKVVRNELFSQLDIYYEFVLVERPNEKAFLINEKNLKKVYFDNQIMKLNYIRLYHNVIGMRERYNKLKIDVSSYIWFPELKNIIEKFDYKERLETLILNQNRVLSEITKMIVEYTSDNNFNIVDVSSESIVNIESYNNMTLLDINSYIDNIQKVENLLEYEMLKSEFDVLYSTHKNQWSGFIFNNEISKPKKVSYTDQETFVGSVPFSVELEAKEETVDISSDGSVQKCTFEWDFGNGILKSGKETFYTFYEEGLQKVKCTMTYPSGKTVTRFLEFKVDGATNSQSVKTETFKYSPITKIDSTAKITYYDSEEGKQITIPINIDIPADKTITDILDEGSIPVSESEAELLAIKQGLVILGYEGTEIAGLPFNNDTIFTEDFEMPEEAEFLFDFKISDPIMGRSSIDISESKFIDYITKAPKSKINSVYEIEDASVFQPITSNILPVLVGDILIIKNKMARYAVVEIVNMREITDTEEQSYYFEIEFKVHVNISLNKYDRMVFKPNETTLNVPTLVFKSDVKEMFAGLIASLERIDELNIELNSTDDMEKQLTIKNEILQLEQENSSYYLFEEYNKLEAKIFGLKEYREILWGECNVSDTSCLETLKTKNNKFKTQIQNTIGSQLYMNGIHAYDFTKNIVDLTVLNELYEEQLLAMKILLDTYNFKKYDSINHFKMQLHKLKYFPIEDIQELETLGKSYTFKLSMLVEKIRDFIFKIKILLDFPILSEGKHILFSQIFTRPKMNESTGEWFEAKNHDFYLLNKKLEMVFGWESEKVEMGANYIPMIEDVILEQKELFGNGLTNDDLSNLGNYIQVVEQKAIDEYDDFFMIPYWIDYLKNKN